MKVSILQESNNYVCVHAKKGKYNCRAETSYGAAKKAAEHWGLKSTSGIDAHLADKEKTATEGLEGMTPNTQVRGIMPKQRKPYHKHKIKSNHEPKVEEESIKEAYINNAKDAINILGQLRGRGKQLERGQQEYKGNLPNEYVNDVWDVWTWMESKLGGGAEANDPKLKQIMQEVFWLRGEAKKMERNYSPDLERSEDYMGAAGFGNMVVNTLYPLMQWIDMNENKLAEVTEGCGCGPDCSCGGNCGSDCNYSNCNEEKTESKSMLGEVTRSLTEAEFDEAAGEKDACYKKVKSRYKVWPSAYASGALVKCRKVGAANWGNKSKK